MINDLLENQTPKTMSNERLVLTTKLQRLSDYEIEKMTSLEIKRVSRINHTRNDIQPTMISKLRTLKAEE